MEHNLADRILRLPEVIAITAKSRSGIYADMRTGSFPRSVSIGARAVGWRSADIHAWLISLQIRRIRD